MNWDAIGAIGEIIGASAVVVSLVYLATQIRVQNTESRIAGNHAILEGFRNSIAELASPNFSDISYRCMKSVDPLTGQELMQELWSSLVFRNMNQAAAWLNSVTSIPSLNLIPITSFAR
jgi:hypothetical protein